VFDRIEFYWHSVSHMIGTLSNSEKSLKTETDCLT
jgi:hypothetical protein